MASKTCASCLRAVQRQTRSSYRTPRFIDRTFTTTSTRYAEHPEPNATPASSTPSASANRATASSAPKAAEPLVSTLKNKFTTYTAYGVTEVLYRECAVQADYSIPQAQDDNAEIPKTEEGEDLGVGEGWWHTELGLKPTFSTWSQVTMLHMYVLAARFRCFPGAQAQPFQQHLLDHFFYDAENKMAVDHAMHSRGMRNKYLKDIYIQWRGLLAAYDEGVVKGDAVLASAIWRNLFKASEDVDIRKLAQITSYMRRLLHSVDSLPDHAIMAGQFKFSSPKDESNVVRLKSPMMDAPFQKGDDLSGKKGE